MSDSLANRDADVALEPQQAPTIFGTSDPQAIVKKIGDVSAVLMEAVQQRNLSMPIQGQDFLFIEAWQFLGSMMGVTARVTWTRPLEDGSGWEAHAEAINSNDVVLGAADGMFKFAERPKNSEHAVRTMAQIRARRGALKSVLGFIARIGGINIPDPQGPLSGPQLKALHTLAGLHGWSDEEKHRRAGVKSLKDLTFEQASELFSEWSEGLESTTTAAASSAHVEGLAGAEESADVMAARRGPGVRDRDGASSPAESSGAGALAPGDGEASRSEVPAPDASSGEEATGLGQGEDGLPSGPASSQLSDQPESEASFPDATLPGGRYDGRLISEIAAEDPDYLRSQLSKLTPAKREIAELHLAAHGESE